MFIPHPRKGEKASDPATAMFKYWISFWPVAPLFGVKWCFGDITMPTCGNMAARPADLARAGVEVQERAAMAAAEAPAVAKPAAEEAAGKAKASLEAVEDAVETQIDAGETATASKPSGLKSKAPAQPDDLKLIKGIGPSLERQLNGLGIYSFEQMAKLDDDELAWVDDHIETATFKGRCYRDDWVGQAKAQLD
ncbi:MAG TPA: hypothetical protein VMM55_00275 [Thermohalobaculum sp.]|nr:hypothetical protein [Thermohalobaculum sp.]